MTPTAMAVTSAWRCAPCAAMIKEQMMKFAADIVTRRNGAIDACTMVFQRIVNGGKNMTTKTSAANRMASRDAPATRPRQYRLHNNNDRWIR